MARKMTPEEIRIRSMYLFLSCSQTVEQFKDQLAATFSSLPLSAQLTLDKFLKRELAMLCRYWATRQIWQQLESDEAAATQLNLALLRLFTDGFKLPKDGSGLRYAELSTSTQQGFELSHRITNALGMEHPPLLAELQRLVGAWRELVYRATSDALQLPLDQLVSMMKDWATQSPKTNT